MPLLWRSSRESRSERCKRAFLLAPICKVLLLPGRPPRTPPRPLALSSASMAWPKVKSRLGVSVCVRLPRRY